MEAYALVVTSIAEPNAVLTALADGAARAGWTFVVIGDAKSPATFELDDCRFFSLARQRATGFSFAEQCPVGHYARKNIGYLIAIHEGATCIVETDDDNIPGASFFAPRVRRQNVALSHQAGWVNAYQWFSRDRIWPRGFPLNQLATSVSPLDELRETVCDCTIQQGLVDDNPDVDAVYRLTRDLPIRFSNARVALGPGSWCPFNSQNTSWFRPAFRLLYLPATCSFRMTDIWRSFVAQRIAWVNDWPVLFHEPTVVQRRNDHDLMRDFSDEIAGYLNNDKIAAALERLPLEPGADRIAANMRTCYECLLQMQLVGAQELDLLEAWLADLSTFDG